VKHRTRRRLALAGATALAVSLTACAPTSAGPKETVTLAVSTLNNPFFKQMRAGAQEAAEATGVRLEVVTAANSTARQAHQLSKAVRQDSEAVLVNPVDADATGSALGPVLQADIPVVAVDREVQGANVASTITSDNVDGARQAAFALADSIEFSGQVIHLRGTADTSASAERGRGFAEGIAQYDDVTVVARRRADFDQSQARRLTARLLQAYPGVDAIFAENDEMALGAVQALGGRAGTTVKVVGFDGTAQALRAVEAGTMEATVAQRPEQLGQVAVQQAVAALDGGTVVPTVPVGVELVTADNVSQYR
jgi:ribose transport system substrate-binding protein